MKPFIFLSLFVALCLVGCGDKSSSGSSTSSSGGSPTTGNNPLNAPADYLNNLANAQKTALKVTDIASLKKAIELYNAQEGHFPKSLNDLVTTQIIARVPDAPPGMKLDYDPNTGDVKIVNK